MNEDSQLALAREVVARGAELARNADVVEAELPHVELSENNSGGSWWLTDDDWRNLEKAGWVVEWASKLIESDRNWLRSSVKKDDKGVWRYMGALAVSARRYGLSVRDAKTEFEGVTGQDPEDEGCSCCGQPHWFSESWS